MSQEKKSSVGDPIWVETLMTPVEYKESARKYGYDGSIIQFNPSAHGGGKWRAGMGGGYTQAEIAGINKNLDNLYKLLQTKKFQKRPDYGPHAEAKS